MTNWTMFSLDVGRSWGAASYLMGFRNDFISLETSPHVFSSPSAPRDGMWCTSAIESMPLIRCSYADITFSKSLMSFSLDCTFIQIWALSFWVAIHSFLGNVVGACGYLLDHSNIMSKVLEASLSYVFLLLVSSSAFSSGATFFFYCEQFFI